MAEEKQFMDFNNLKSYDKQIKELIESEDSAILAKVEEEYLAKRDFSWKELEE